MNLSHLGPKKTHRCVQSGLFAQGEFMEIVLLNDIVPIAELRACVGTDARGRSGDHMVLKSVPVVGAVVC